LYSKMAAKSPEEEHPVKAFGWAAKDSSGVFSPFKFSRRATGEKDVRFKVLYCGICHSDLAMVKNEWGMSQYPIVPGYDLILCLWIYLRILDYNEEEPLRRGGTRLRSPPPPPPRFYSPTPRRVINAPLPSRSGRIGSAERIDDYDWRSGRRDHDRDPGRLASEHDSMVEDPHEIVGVVTEVGCKVERFKVGDNVGVGCLVGSCMSCDSCTTDLENYCPKQILTYAYPYHDGTITYGGYSDTMVADEHFVLSWPENLPLDGGAPLLCAGITTYSPLRHFGLDKPGMHVGVVGLGGLGHVAVKMAKAFGTKVTVISTSIGKKEEAIEKLGADSFLVSRDPEQMQMPHIDKLAHLNVPNVNKAATGTLDGIIDTVSATHPIAPLIGLLKAQGKLILVGAPEKPLELPSFSLIVGRKIVAGSCIGGLKETQEMLDFSAKHNITADVEVVPMDYVNTAMERLAKADVRYRFVIDVAGTLKAA
ncbi:hypothetical protein RJ640_013908, partial [Escallonia rubra]